MPDSLVTPNDVVEGASHRSSCEGGERRGPLVSVLLPTHNRRRCLSDALASVLRQTYRDLEVFVIRDGGEEVDDVVRSFRDPRVIFIDREENRGKPYSLNEALRRANGKYVAYLDDDDVFYPDHVETLVEALEMQTDCQVAYSDLYRAYYEILPGGRRAVLSKQVEISRDFDRFFMLYFNHVLHVSLMHRRDLLDKTGLYNENLNVLIDWDMTRRLTFFSDFHHVLSITGEFSSPLGESDRISVQRRKDPQEYHKNVLTIRTTHPPKPWPKIGELSILMAADRLDRQVARTLMEIGQYTFYPYRLYLPLPAADLARLNIEIPNIVLVPVAPHSSTQERLDIALKQASGQYVAVVPSGLSIADAWVESPLYALIHNPTKSEALLLSETGAEEWGVVLERADLLRARNAYPHLSVESSLAASGINVRPPKPEELPFQMDELLRQAQNAEVDGNWLFAAQAFEHIGNLHRNELWMKTLAARAYFEAGRPQEAARLSSEVNRIRPTVDTLLLEAKVRKYRRDLTGAIRLLRGAEQRLSGRGDWTLPTESDYETGSLLGRTRDCNHDG